MGLKRQLRQLNGFPLRRRGVLGLLILLIASYLGNLARWNFFKVDLIFGSIAVWLVVGFYRVRWEPEVRLVQNDLLDLQRLASGTQSLELEPISLQDWVLHIVESFQERTRNRQQTLQIEISDKLPVITSDPICLERILTELLNNACKYTPPGEKIRVAACTVGPSDCEAAVMTETTAKTIAKTTGGDRLFAIKPFSAAPNLDSEQNFASLSPPNSDFFVLRVCNSGVEIPAESLDHIFEKFYRVPGIDRWKQGGTGLGLALVQKMTEHLGGSIQVASAARQTCFTVALPVVPPHQTASQSAV